MNAGRVFTNHCKYDQHLQYCHGCNQADTGLRRCMGGHLRSQAPGTDVRWSPLPHGGTGEEAPVHRGYGSYRGGGRFCGAEFWRSGYWLTARSLRVSRVSARRAGGSSWRNWRRFKKIRSPVAEAIRNVCMFRDGRTLIAFI